MVYKFFRAHWLSHMGRGCCFSALFDLDASKDSDIPKNVPFAFAINNRNTSCARGGIRIVKDIC